MSRTRSPTSAPIDRNWRRWRRRRKPRCAAITWTSLRIGATLKVRKSWPANRPGSRSRYPSRKLRAPSRQAALGNLILFIWPRTMSIAARPARSWRTTSPLMKMARKCGFTWKACRTCPFKDQCTTSNERRIKRWEHEHVVEAAQTRLDQNPQAMRVRRETVEHPLATLKMRMGATHFLMKRLPNVATEMALNVLAYNLTRVINIVGIKPLLVAIRA